MGGMGLVVSVMGEAVHLPLFLSSCKNFTYAMFLAASAY